MILFVVKAKMELSELFQALREATSVLSRHSVTFVEDDEKHIKMDLPTFIIRALGEVLLDQGMPKEEIEKALTTDCDKIEVPTGNCWHIVVQGSLK